MTSSLELIEINPNQSANASIIWLHGLGASGDDFVSIVPALRLSESIQARFIFPHAPRMPVTLNFGYVMPAWFDIIAVHEDAEQDIKGILATDSKLRDLIEKEIARGIPSHRIILAGFSQGGAMALFTGLHAPQKLGGIIALSTFLPLQTSFGESTSKANAQIPIYQAHGTLDDIVPFDYGETTRECLTQRGYPVDWHTYPMGHSVCAQEISDISSWLERQLS